MIRFYLFSVLFLIFQLTSPGVFSQRKVIEGNIIDSATGQKISNVNIFESLAGIGTISGNSGNFRLMLSQGAVNLSVSVEGYKTLMKQFVLKSDTVMDFILNPVKQITLSAENNSQDNTLKTEVHANHQKLRQK
jgi:hypothetical protein